MPRASSTRGRSHPGVLEEWKSRNHNWYVSSLLSVSRLGDGEGNNKLVYYFFFCGSLFYSLPSSLSFLLWFRLKAEAPSSTCN